MQLSCVIFAEPICLTILYPFMVLMVKDFHLSEDERDVGFYAGFLAAAFSLAQFFTSVPIGLLSNRIGRRPVILCGLFGNILCSIAFGLSKSFWMAMAFRLLSGAVNGNIGVAKSVLGEICDESNLSKGFSIFGLLFGVGSLVGSGLGGLLAQPAQKYPFLFGSSWFLKEFPYLLPCLVSCLVSLVGLVIGFFYLEESLPALAGYQHLAGDDDEVLGVQSENVRGSVLSTVSHLSTVRNVMAVQATTPAVDQTFNLDLMRNQYATIKSQDDEEALLNDTSRSKHFESVVEFEVHEDQSTTHQQQQKQQKVEKLYLTAPVLGVACYCVIAITQVMNQEAYVLYCQTSEHLGGLGWSSTEVGLSMASAGVMLLLFQSIIYPRCQLWRGNWNLCRDSMLIIAPFLFVTAFMTDLKGFFVKNYGVSAGQIALWSFTLVHHFFRIGMQAFSFTSIMVLVNNSVPLQKLSLINGVAQSLASLARALGPVLCGIAWQYSLKNGLGYPLNYHFVFILLTAVSLTGSMIAARIPKSANRKFAC